MAGTLDVNGRMGVPRTISPSVDSGRLAATARLEPGRQSRQRSNARVPHRRIDGIHVRGLLALSRFRWTIAVQ
jgi:hypothetical protein